MCYTKLCVPNGVKTAFYISGLFLYLFGVRPVFLLNMKHYGLPGFETVRRSRQKVQADNPDLAGNAAVRRKRAKQEAVYREFAASEG